MTTANVIALLREILATLPAAITTGAQIIALVNESYQAMRESIADREVTSDEIRDLVNRINSNSTAIQQIE